MLNDLDLMKNIEDASEDEEFQLRKKTIKHRTKREENCASYGNELPEPSEEGKDE